MSKCMVFKPFPIYPSVCDECGKDKDSHSKKNADMLPYKEAVWKFMLEYGGPYNFYAGGPETKGYPKRKKVLKHVEVCGLNWEKISTPEMDRKEEFNGTFAESSSYVDIVLGYIICNCGEYKYSKYTWEMQDWCVADKTLGEIIWLVVKAGEKKEVDN